MNWYLHSYELLIGMNWYMNWCLFKLSIVNAFCFNRGNGTNTFYGMMNHRMILKSVC